ncbi:hypothetical protein [Paenibacillus nasutitermitis]|uniref:Uncharacterized protein n=1 Tax=Paenibacillus nasutitermitis TaxID=1652958 RepID=A0A916ZA23_9BACL|nr:hypothetical protein [Paenibacillus nasutitermitis]GGD83802.1 hypothetical protein GCM10010911_47510 [Paenibacillus nasutitermitis]
MKGVRLKILEANMAQNYFGIVELEVNDGSGPNQATSAAASATSLNSDPNHSSADGVTGWTKVASSYKMPAGKLSADMNQLAADGFNVMHPSAASGNGFDTSFVDDAGVKGIKLIPENIATLVNLILFHN